MWGLRLNRALDMAPRAFAPAGTRSQRPPQSIPPRDSHQSPTIANVSHLRMRQQRPTSPWSLLETLGRDERPCDPMHLPRGIFCGFQGARFLPRSSGGHLVPPTKPFILCSSRRLRQSGIFHTGPSALPGPGQSRSRDPAAGRHVQRGLPAAQPVLSVSCRGQWRLGGSQ